MKFDRNILLLCDVLQSLGFEGGLENKLRAQICFQPERFTIPHRIHKDPDVMDCVLFFEMHDSNGYACRYYDAILRKRSLVEELVINDINVLVLDKRMSQVDWDLVSVSTAGIQEREEAIDSIITELKKLDTSDDGRKVADALRLKYWPGTVVEGLLPIGIRSRHEIVQRFYFFDGRSQITVEEAYRYLCNRWMEKELNARKKQPGIAEANKEGNEEDLQKKSKAGAKKKGR